MFKIPCNLTNLSQVYDNNEKGQGGFFPIGINNLWHGGIHLNLHNNTQMYPLLDGTLVAYRITGCGPLIYMSERITRDTYNLNLNRDVYFLDKSSKTLYTEKYKDCYEIDSNISYNYVLKDKYKSDEKKEVIGSSTFFLIKHAIKYGNKDANVLWFFSFYMHLSPYNIYFLESKQSVYFEKQGEYPKEIEISGTKYYNMNDINKPIIQLPFYMEWVVRLHDISKNLSTWKLRQNGNDLYPYSLVEIIESNCFHNGYDEIDETELTINNYYHGKKNQEKVLRKYINIITSDTYLKIKAEKKLFLFGSYGAVFDENSILPTAYTENTDLSITYQHDNQPDSEFRKIGIPEKPEDKELEDARKIFGIGFLPEILLSKDKKSTLKKCFGHVPLPSTSTNIPDGLFRVVTKEEFQVISGGDVAPADDVVLFNSKYVVYPKGAEGIIVTLPSREIIFTIHQVDQNDTNYVEVSISEMLIFVSYKDLETVEDVAVGTRYRVKSLDDHIYFYDDTQGKYRIAFTEGSKNSSAALDYIKKCFFRNGDLILNTIIEQSNPSYTEERVKGKHGSNDDYRRMKVGNLNWKFWVDKSVLAKIPGYTENTDNTITVANSTSFDMTIYPDYEPENEYLFIRNGKKFDVYETELGRFPVGQTKDEALAKLKEKGISLYVMHKTYTVNSSTKIELLKDDPLYGGEELWKALKGSDGIVRPVKFTLRETKAYYYANQSFLEIGSGRTGRINPPDNKKPDSAYVLQQGQVVIYNSDEIKDNTPFGMPLSTKKIETEFVLGCSFPELSHNRKMLRVIKISDENKIEYCYVYLPKDTTIALRNQLREDFSLNKATTCEIPMSMDDNMGGGGNFLLDDNFCHLGTFLKKMPKDISFSYYMLEKGMSFYKLQATKQASKDFEITLPSGSIEMEIVEPSSVDFIGIRSKKQDFKVRIKKLYVYIHKDDLNVAYEPNFLTYKVKSLNHYIYFFDDSGANRYRIYFKNNIPQEYSAIPEQYSSAIAEQHSASSDALKIMKSKFFKNGDLLVGKELKYTGYCENNSDPTGTGEKNYYRMEVGNTEWDFWIKSDSSFLEAPSAVINQKDKKIVISEAKAFNISVYSGHDEYYESPFVPPGNVTYPLFIPHAETPFVCYARSGSGGTTSLGLYYSCIVNKEECFIKKDDRDKARRTEIRWSDFLNIQEGDKDHDLVCDLQAEIIEKINGQDDQVTISSEELLGVFHNQNIMENKAIVEGLRKMACSFPFEWDKGKYSSNSLKELVDEYHFDILEEEARHTEAIMKEMDVWGTIKDIKEIDNASRLTHLHPLYFTNFLDTLGMLDFNPYRGHTFSGTGVEPFQCISNPGFAPYIGKGKYQGYAETSGVFNQDYRFVNEERIKEGWKVYAHEGIDFCAPEGTPIRSFIYGTVKANYLHRRPDPKTGGWMGMGGVIVVQDAKDQTLFYVLVHLERYDMVNTGQLIYPGMEIGTVGRDVKKLSGAHLHVSCVRKDPKENSLVFNSVFTYIDTKTFWFNWWIDNPSKEITKRILNPFDHNGLTWEGRHK